MLQRITRRIFLLPSVLIMACLCACTPAHQDNSASQSPAPEKDLPNIILVMADDQGWGDMAYNGHPVLKNAQL